MAFIELKLSLELFDFFSASLLAITKQPVSFSLCVSLFLASTTSTGDIDANELVDEDNTDAVVTSPLVVVNKVCGGGGGGGGGGGISLLAESSLTTIRTGKASGDGGGGGVNAGVFIPLGIVDGGAVKAAAALG